jgi:hypothetical protein
VLIPQPVRLAVQRWDGRIGCLRATCAALFWSCYDPEKGRLGFY